MKIVLAGALGYLGMALVEQLRDDDTVDEVVLVDNLFRGPLVANLPEEFRFCQLDIGESTRIQRICEGADTVVLLAGITEAEKSRDREALVWETNFDKSCVVADALDPATRLVFCSTGNLFGGVPADGKWQGLNETDFPHPRLPYASSKFAFENYLREKDTNYTICRFGTVFGYSPGVRFNIVTNIFVQRALLGQNLILHGRGRNYRPNVHAEDAARAMLYLAGKSEARGETYHVVRHNMTIRELAETVVEVIPNCSLVLDDREIPFNSYDLSSDKLKSAGFEFKWDLKDGVRDMADRFQAIRGL